MFEITAGYRKDIRNGLDSDHKQRKEREKERERGGGGWEETRQKGKKRALWNAGNGISFAVGKSSGWASSSPGCFFFPFFPFYDASNILGRFPRSLLSLKSF